MARSDDFFDLLNIFFGENYNGYCEYIRYDKEKDYLEVIFVNMPWYAEQVGKYLSVYKSFETEEIVGLGINYFREVLNKDVLGP